MSQQNTKFYVSAKYIMVLDACVHLHLLLLHETEVVDTRWHCTGVKVGIILLGLRLTDRGEQKDGPLEFIRMSSIFQQDRLVVIGPVGRCGNGLFIRKLQGLYATDNLVHVAADAGWVVEVQHELVFGVDDEHRTNGQRECLFVRITRVDHTVGHRDLTVRVAVASS